MFLIAMVINTNISALTSSRLLQTSATHLARSLARLSSGSRIVSPEDDAAGLAQSMKLGAQVHRNEAANANIANAISLSQTQDGELKKMQKVLDRFSELAVLSLDVTKTDEDRMNYSVESDKFIDHTLASLDQTFNGVSLFGTATLAVTIDSDGNKFNLAQLDLLSAMTPLLGSGGPLGSTQTVADAKEAIQEVAALRAKVGSNIARLNMESEALTNYTENLTAANSRIADIDVAQESTSLARYNILTQSGTAMLAQANLLPQSALRLLG
jgi:flagellin